MESQGFMSTEFQFYKIKRVLETDEMMVVHYNCI